MKYYLIIITICLVSSSCTKSIYLSDLRPQNKNSLLLPPLEPRVDIRSLETVFSIGHTTAITSKSIIASTQSISVTHRDPRIQDAITIFDRDVKNNITQPYGDRKGYIIFRIAGGSSYINNNIMYLWIICAIPPLFGAPLGYAHTLLDIDVEIYNVSEELIGKYSAQGYNKTKIGLYDHSHQSAKRITAIDAFKLAMNDVKTQILKDYNRLYKELNK